jgi:hypothetical protein
VSGIGTALVTSDYINVLGDQVDNLALSFVAPLASDNNRYWHISMTMNACDSAH